MMKISGIYKITNTVTGDFYIGSSKNIKQRWNEHKCQSRWNRYSNSQLYLDMNKYGLDNFEFQVLVEVEEGKLKDAEQKFIETLKPTYNDRNANGYNIERRKERHKERNKKKRNREYQKEYRNQLCIYNNEILTLNALAKRFSKAGIEHPQIEAKKYLLNNIKDK